MKPNVSLPARLRAARRGLQLLRQLAKRPSTFARYGGHLLLAFYFIASTSHDAVLRRTALAAGRERARHWRRQWHLKPRRLDARTVCDEICASYAAGLMGIPDRRIRHQLEAAIARYEPRALLGFDPRLDIIPRNLPDDCECGAVNERGRRRCRKCRRTLSMRSKYSVLVPGADRDLLLRSLRTSLAARAMRTFSACCQELRPYPRPGTRHHRDAVYAVTHIVYTLNDYNRVRLPGALVFDGSALS